MIRSPTAVFALGLLVAAAASCKGCSEECSDQKQGSEGCPCQSDQDCTTRLGEVLLCDEGGTCKPGNPPDAEAKGCDKSSDCPDGQACGFKRCQPAPKCQRVDVTEMTAVVVTGANADAAVAATIARDGCAHTVTFGDSDDTISIAEIGLDGALSEVAGTAGCTAGEWHAAYRAGVFTCGADTVIVSVGTPCAVGAVGSACSDDLCEERLIDTELDEVGVCP